MALAGCGALFMGEEEQQFVGLWRSNSWGSSDSYYDYFYSSDPEYCYYDFTDDGRVFVTDYTESFNFYEYAGIPVNFNYSVSDTGNELSFKQFAGLIDIEFDIISMSETSIELEVISTTDNLGIYSGDTLTLSKLVEYDDAARTVQAYFEEYKNEN